MINTVAAGFGSAGDLSVHVIRGEALKEEGILCKETHERVIRFAPPLVITREDIDWAFDRIRRVIERR